jgi:hypothetical protein
LRTGGRLELYILAIGALHGSANSLYGGSGPARVSTPTLG